MATVTIYTQVYNTEPYIRQCVESVLGQSFSDFEYVIIDNGSTDGCKEILEQYAQSDSRIRLLRFKENAPGRIWKAAETIGNGPYFSALDSDDWIESDYLGSLLSFAEKEKLDIACTGSTVHLAETGGHFLRSVPGPLILEGNAIANALPQYHVFFRTHWNKLIRFDILRRAHPAALPAIYGRDTLICFQCLRSAKRIGVDRSILHHYRIHGQSASYQYNSTRFAADVYLYNDAIDFLSTFGSISSQNRNFLQCVYSNAVIDTTGVIQHSALSPKEKLQEYRVIAEHPVTRAAFRECTDESAPRSKRNLLQKTLEAGRTLGKQDDEDFRAVVQMLLPHCGQAVSAANVSLFLEDSQLLNGLLQDKPEDILENLLVRMEQKHSTKKYDIPAAIQALAVDDPFLCWIDDAVFLRKYGKIYRMVWRGEKSEALEEMAGILLDSRVDGGKETFLKLFLSLAAALEQPAAFIFGKLQLGKLYLRQGRRPECTSIVVELEDMGLADNEELDNLRKHLGFMQ